ncbi:MAG: PA0069 family radical SAM protein [Pseudomonadota bacterium]
MDGAPPFPPNGPQSTPGRGAPSNHVPLRFGLSERVDDPDWLDERETIDGARGRPRTTVTVDHARTIINRITSPDIPLDQSINMYRGCEHGCIYCYARPSHARYDLSPGLDFETHLFAKPDAAVLLRAELARPSYVMRPIAIGTNTDPYQPIERDWRLTRQIIELLSETGHPLFITTKSDRIVRDIDLLADMARRRLVHVILSVTTLDPALARKLEPRAPRPAKRLAAIAALSAAGVPTQVNVAPIIPAITDHEIEHIIAEAAAAGACRAGYTIIRLPHEVAALFREWLAVHFPDRASKVMAIIRDLRGGRDYDPRYFKRMHGGGIWGDLIRTRFNRARRIYGLGHRGYDIDLTAFVPPERGGQMRLL